ncbi:hypothetical protein ASPZODRAFT_62397, partial [Penicilliopsis zonata CBS 506.65]
MSFSKFFLAVAAVPSFALLTSALDVNSNTNVVVYYGQGDDQQRLSHFCGETSLDIINLGFVNEFPDQAPGGWPGSNFGNQCGSGTYTNEDGEATDLLSECIQLAEDIPVCQAAGKTVLLSLGGASPTNQQIESHDSAIAFADFLWGAFGPVDDTWIANNGPRPFGGAVVDGFDFDIENNGGYGYATMVKRLREHFADYPDQTFYISGAPQCVIPDPQLAHAITHSEFDFVWVQFYNTEECAASNSDGFNYDDWVTFLQQGESANAKLMIGLPADTDSDYYLTPDQVNSLVETEIAAYPDTFGGIMIWEATSSDENVIDDMTYAENMKSVLVA